MCVVLLLHGMRPARESPSPVILPDIQIDLVALLKALDPRIKFPTDFPTPYYIRLVRPKHHATA